jgi:hypothetical protein
MRATTVIYKKTPQRKQKNVYKITKLATDLKPLTYEMIQIIAGRQNIDFQLASLKNRPD